MTLAQIVERLERIERMPLTSVAESTYGVRSVPNSAVTDALRDLRRDLEMALIKAGQL